MKEHKSEELLERLAPFYESLWAPLGMLITARRTYSSIMQEAADFLDCERILDVGAGTGKLHDFLHCEDYVALDISERFLKILNRKRKKSSAIRATALRLPFRRESFEGVAMLFVLHMIEDKDEALKEINRVLKKGGKFICSVLTLNSRISILLSKWWSIDLLTKKEYVNLFSRNGFNVYSHNEIGAWTIFKCVKDII